MTASTGAAINGGLATRDNGPPAEDFEAFYRANVDRVYRALAVTLRRDDLAGEAVAEAMARAYQRWSTVGNLENPAGWVFRVGLNWATSWWRKVRRERPPGDQPDHGRRGAAENVVMAREALDRLPRPQRAVVTCRILLDMSTAETAEALRISEGTVKSRLSRALADLRRDLNEEA
ncbi:RNA polymerase sigma (SigV) subunit [Actinoplanes lutulentus]|uniref:RNA polymerase sigma (SigV) subunit n=2 Tax=Actinoplanes lutulentus TaxID=1287878 RepID=A0A327ZM66_9ACTN|nr:RNA polymerase sigma (SigV) subunit [Actinoplanes lutulentus]